ncbi:holin [Salmonella enterica]|nr:holin [Salmonella enterica]EIU8982109.1 holin [Salmonella enterica]
MQNGETSLLAKLLLIGAVIGLGQLMLSSERITTRLLLGRVIMGSAVAPLAAIPLLKYPDMPELVVVGLACALGILGSAFIEECFKRAADMYFKWKGKKTS